MQFNLNLGAAALVTSLLATPVLADDTENASAALTVIKPISIEVTAPLSFGEFSPVANGIVDMNDDGSIVCMMDYCGGSPSQAGFIARGDPNVGFRITGPGNFFVRNGYGNKMEIGNIRFVGDGVTVVSYFKSTSTLDSSGQRAFQMVGSLWMGPDVQPVGNYSGDYDVTIEYD